MSKQSSPKRTIPASFPTVPHYFRNTPADINLNHSLLHILQLSQPAIHLTTQLTIPTISTPPQDHRNNVQPSSTRIPPPGLPPPLPNLDIPKRALDPPLRRHRHRPQLPLFSLPPPQNLSFIHYKPAQQTMRNHRSIRVSISCFGARSQRGGA